MLRGASLIAIAAALVLAAVAWPSEAAAKGDPGWIEGGDLPHRIYLGWSDFIEWLEIEAAPEVLDAPPATPGPSYRIGDMAWELAPRAGSAGAAVLSGSVSSVQNEGTYHRAARAVEVHLANDSKVWLRLDDERAQMLAYYIDLGMQGYMAEGVPSELHMIAVRVERSTEPGSIVVDGEERHAPRLWSALARHEWPLRWFSNEDAPELWSAFEAAWWDAPNAAASIVTLAEPGGRSESVYYFPGRAVLVGRGQSIYVASTLRYHVLPA
ncbi:MAG: hypothetical protein O2895_06550 [Chloroflexi bacterium]|nr:hypothetical protein [Chloroflexota bacterium]